VGDWDLMSYMMVSRVFTDLFSQSIVLPDSYWDDIFTDLFVVRAGVSKRMFSRSLCCVVVSCRSNI
jgi:hypothetical protein